MANDNDRSRSFRTTPGGTRLVPIATPRAQSLTPFRAALGFGSAKKAPVRSLVVLMPTDHSFPPDRVAARMPQGVTIDTDVVVACAGQPSDLAAIHAALPAAQFLLAPAGTSCEDLRVLAVGQAVGDVVTLICGVPTSAAACAPGERMPLRSAAQPSLSVVVPVYNDAAFLDDAIVGIEASTIPRDSYELIVVDDGSTDGSATIAARYADTLIRLSGRRRGAAYARNRGAEEARGEVVAFIDGDARVHRDTLARLLAAFREDSGLAAVGASNDGTTADGGFAAQYWNALEQYGAQRHGGLGSHFSAVCGAVRRNALVSVGMYNEWMFRGASLEDLDLGQRLQKVGQRVLLAPDVAVSHYAPLRVRSVFGMAWSRSVLLMRSIGYGTTRRRARGHAVHSLCNAGAIWALLASAIGAGVARAMRLPWEWPAAFAVTLLLLADLEFFRFLARRRSVGFTIAAIPLHLLAQLVGIVGLGTGWVLHHAIGDPAPDATTQAFAEMGVQMWPPVPRKP